MAPAKVEATHLRGPVKRPEPAPFSTTDDASELVALLTDAAVCLAEFRRRLERAGYPFREPEACKVILARLNNACEAAGHGVYNA